MRTRDDRSKQKKYDKTALTRSRAIQNLNDFNAKKDDKTRIYENVCWLLNAEKDDKTCFHEDVCRALNVVKIRQNSAVSVACYTEFKPF